MHYMAPQLTRIGCCLSAQVGQSGSGHHSSPARQHLRPPARHRCWQLVLEWSVLNCPIHRHNWPLTVQGRTGTEGIVATARPFWNSPWVWGVCLSVRSSGTAPERDHVLSLSPAKSWKSFKPAAHCSTSTFLQKPSEKKLCFSPVQGVL